MNMSNFNNVNLGDVFNLVDLWYIPMGDAVPVYNRPFVVSSDESAIVAIADRMQENATSLVSSSIINDFSSRLIQPNPVGEITVIDDNWVSNKRYIFMLKVHTTDTFGVEGFTYVQGYTDHNGVTPNGTANEAMVHHINNVIETSVLTYQTPTGYNRVEKLHKIYNVLASHSQEFFTQRPRDVIDNIDLLAATNAMTEANILVEGVSTGNYVNPFNNNVISSAASNNVGGEYLCKILNGGIAKSKSASFFTDSFDMTSSSNMGEAVIEPSINDNRFLKHLSYLAGHRNTRDFFTFGALTLQDVSIRDRFKLINISKSFLDPLTAMTPNVGEYWHGQDGLTLKAYSLIESAVSMGTRHGFNKLFFTATNMSTPTGEAIVTITNFKSYINLGDKDISHLLEIFKNKFIMDVFIGETNGGIMPLYMEMYMDLLGTSKIKLTYAGSPETWFTIPTAANSLFSPVLTVDRNSLDVVSQQFGNLVDAVAGYSNQNLNYY